MAKRMVLGSLLVTAVATATFAATAWATTIFYCNNCSLGTSYASGSLAYWDWNRLDVFQARPTRVQYSNTAGQTILVSQFQNHWNLTTVQSNAPNGAAPQCRLWSGAPVLAQCRANH